MNGKRFRCSGCGNVTRFDVRVRRETTAYHHYTVGGELNVEDEVIVIEEVDRNCRWCGPGTKIVEEDAPVASNAATRQTEV